MEKLALETLILSRYYINEGCYISGSYLYLTKKSLLTKKLICKFKKGIYKITPKGVVEILKYRKIPVKHIKYFYKNMEDCKEKENILKYITLELLE